MNTQKTIAAYSHKSVRDVQDLDPRPGNYYCSVMDNARTGLLLGPFRTHKEALDMLPEAQDKAHEVCVESIWFAFGTVRMRDDYTKPGVLNKFFPELFTQKEAA